MLIPLFITVYILCKVLIIPLVIILLLIVRKSYQDSYQVVIQENQKIYSYLKDNNLLAEWNNSLPILDKYNVYLSKNYLYFIDDPTVDILIINLHQILSTKVNLIYRSRTKYNPGRYVWEIYFKIKNTTKDLGTEYEKTETINTTQDLTQPLPVFISKLSELSPIFHLDYSLDFNTVPDNKTIIKNWISDLEKTN